MSDETIRLTADVVAIAPDATGLEHVLLIRRRWEPFEGHWALPGGHVDTEESVRTAAARELAEETGLDVAEGDLTELGAWHEPGRDPRGRYVTVAYRADLPKRATRPPLTTPQTPAGCPSTSFRTCPSRSTTARSFAVLSRRGTPPGTSRAARSASRPASSPTPP